MDGRAGGRRRRSRLVVPRRWRVAPVLSEEEYAVIVAAAAREGRAVNAWIADVAVRVARNEVDPLPADWREVLAELMAARTQVRRAGSLLNQVARRVNATGTAPAAVARILDAVDRVVQRLDVLTERAVRHLGGPSRRGRRSAGASYVDRPPILPAVASGPLDARRLPPVGG